MFHVLWEYRVAEDRREQFERLYAPDGDWARLFQQSSDFLSTTLLHDAAVPSRYLTIDRWQDAGSYNRFLEEHALQYGELDRQGESLTEYELKVGTFESVS